MTNSCSPQPPRTSGNWQRSFLHRSKRAKRDKEGVRAGFGPTISARANGSFSTEWAESRLTLQQQGDCGITLKAAIRAPRSDQSTQRPVRVEINTLAECRD